MYQSLPTPFPDIDISDDYNPGIRLFGKRFISEQTIVEYLVEFLALVLSEKKIDGKSIDAPLPSIETIKKWPQGKRLTYRLPVRLNLKLFSFLGSSRVDSRHKVHKDHYRELNNKLKDKINADPGKKENVAEWLEKFLQGYHGAGANRTWCAQTFFPITKGLITQEAIWNKSIAKKMPPSNWVDSVENLAKYYSISKHRFLARGGELLYLQLCNLFSTNSSIIGESFSQFDFNSDETDLPTLHQSLHQGFGSLNKENTAAFDNLVNFIDSLDRKTQELTNRFEDGLRCEWCPSESWPEAYLFAVEINRLLKANLDPVERLELLMTGCALQVLRSLCAQSVRYTDENRHERGGILGYAWLFSHPNMPTRQQRLASQRNIQVIQALIQQALRNKELVANAARHPKKNKEQLYREADNRYGHKLFLSLGKKLGIISPYTGPGARFVMTDKLLRFLITAILPPGKRCTYDEFLHRLYLHYGIAVEGEALISSLLWSELPGNSSLQSTKDSWFAEMLRAGGFLVELSDACSIVRNTFY